MKSTTDTSGPANGLGNGGGGAHSVVNPPNLYAASPVVLLATRNGDGSVNLAPASSYWALGRMLVLGLETDGQTLVNLGDRPQLTVNFPSPPLWSAVERIAGLTGRREVPEKKANRYAYSADKFAVAGLTRQPSDLVDPPRVQECLLQLEAEVRRLTPGVNGNYAIAEAEVVRVHADPRVVGAGDRIDPLAWQPIVYSFRTYFSLGEPLGTRGSAASVAVDESGEDGASGDAACWLASVCPECGAMRERPGACWRCGAA